MKTNGRSTLYFAGGCFWGVEHAFRQLDGVLDTTTGYANGRISNPTYSQVKQGDTGYRETVRVCFDPDVVSVETLLKAFFLIVDVTQEDGQGHDIGDQYRTGVYYPEDTTQSVIKVLQEFFDAERTKHETFHTELKMLECFYDAEDYHQDYLVNNPSGYCHVTINQIAAVKALNRR